MRKIAMAVGSAIALLFGVVFVRTLGYQAPELVVAPAPAVAIPAGAVDRFAGSIRIPTISHEDPAAMNVAAFEALHAYLEAQFPRVHSQLQRETVATHSLLYTWRGTDASRQPILIAGHLDVVPVEAATEDQWQEEPFSGGVRDGFVWGRGAMDDKSTVLGTLEAVEMLLAEDFQPTRTVYLAYGHDEEIGGLRGARAIAALLQGRGIELEVVLDEGGVIADGILASVAAPLALVGIAEKGFVSIELATQAPGGHSSLPPLETAVGILATATARLEQRPMPAQLDAATRSLLTRIGPVMPFLRRAALANLWLTKPLVVRNLARSPSTNAMVRTTAAVTMFQAGTKDNVLPSRAHAVVNFRISPTDSIAAVLEHIARVVDDPRVAARVVGAFSSEPSRVSSVDSESFRTLEQTIRSIAPEVIVAPYLTVVVTDARHYESLSDNVFRFQPLRLAPADLERMHGANERLAIDDYERAVRFYREFILKTAG